MGTRIQSTISVRWGPVIGGVFVALMVHILLSMLGAGIAAASIDIRTLKPPVHGLIWAAFAWWSISGIISAFVGGWAAARLATTVKPDRPVSLDEGAAFGTLVWAITTVLIVAFATLAVGSAAVTAGALFPPLSIARLQANVDAAQTAFATFTLASLGALILGAIAATSGGRLGVNR
jgi:hypothetical protein